MAIIDKTGRTGSIAQGWRALDFFTDRYAAIRLFLSYLNDDPPRDRILFFMGDGGNGKSLLLHSLRQFYCKRLDPQNWAYIRSTSDEELSVHLKNAEHCETVPSALIDFGMQPRGDDRPQEAFSALMLIRRALAGHNLRFPLYDFACIWYLHRTNKLTSERPSNLFPAEETDFISEIVDAVSGTSWAALAKVFLNLVSKHGRTSLALRLHSRKLDEEAVGSIQRMDPESELMNELPGLFAKDLNTAMTLDRAPKRIVLFFDTHEAFWGHQRNLSDDLFFERDEWLRRMLATLELSYGVVAVVAGRESPRWSEARKIPISADYVDLQEVGVFSDRDAAAYLERAGVSDLATRQCLLTFARVNRDRVHPFFLSLCADVVLAASERGTTLTPVDFSLPTEVANKGAILIDRLLRYVDTEVDYAVRALSACRAFDRTIYFELGRLLDFHATEPTFRVLTQFSFVSRVDQDGARGRYRIHELLRRLMRERADEAVVRADEVLEKHYRKRAEAGDTVAVTEAIYHANQLDWKRGADEWIGAFEAALDLSRYPLCRALLSLRSELSVKGNVESGRIAMSAGDYHTSLAHYDEARREYREAMASYNWALKRTPDSVEAYAYKGSAYMKLGELYAAESQYNKATTSYTKAIAALDQALRRAPNHYDSWNDRGVVLTDLGDLHAECSKHEAALEDYGQAIAIFDDALRRVPERVEGYINKAYALMCLGALRAGLSQSKQAADSYAEAIVVCDELLHRWSDEVTAINNKGWALMSLGEMQVGLSAYKHATASYSHAIASYNEALDHAPDDLTAASNKGYAFRSLGELQAELSQYEQAAASYMDAITSHEQVLRRAPDYVVAIVNEAWTYSSLGEMQAELSQYEQAAESYERAITLHKEARSRAPEDAITTVNMACTYTGLGEMQAELSQYKQAAESYDRSVEMLGEALERAPNDVIANINKGYALTSLGKMQASLSQQEVAAYSYGQAITALDAALRHSPDDALALTYKGRALMCLGDVQQESSHSGLAAENYRAALVVYDRALLQASEKVVTHIFKGQALTGIGELHVRLAQHADALESYKQAIVNFDVALAVAPNDVIAHTYKGLALMRLGEVQAELLQYERAIECHGQAITTIDVALAYAPSFVTAHNHKCLAFLSLGQIQSRHTNPNEAVTNFQSALAEVSRSLETAPFDERTNSLREQIMAMVRLDGRYQVGETKSGAPTLDALRRPQWTQLR